MDPIDAATAFLGGLDKDRGSMQNSTVQSETHTITGTATSDSADGLVMVDLEGYTISEDDQQSLELPTTVDVHEGDTVQVTLVGGVAKSPIVTGVVGGGDRLSGNVQDAVDAAEAATEAVSSVTNYFFHNESGAHVTTTPNDATTGNNVLINANGLDVRDGTTPVAYFHADSAQVGADGDSHITIGENSITMSVLYYNPWVPVPQYVIRDVFNIQYNVSNNYVYVFAPTDSLWLQAAYGNVTIASTDGNANASVRLRAGKMIIADENGAPLWTGTAQEMANALKPPIKIQSFSKSVQIGANAFVSTDLGTINVPTGYSYVGIVADNNGYGDQWLVSYSRYGNKCQAMIHSKYGGTLTSTLYAKAIFIRSDLAS